VSSGLVNELAPWGAMLATIIVFYLTRRHDAKRDSISQLEKIKAIVADAQKGFFAQTERINTLVDTCARIEVALFKVVTKEICQTVHAGIDDTSDGFSRRLKVLERRMDANSSDLNFLQGHLNIHQKPREGSDEGL
jgi:hypothetical protein